MAYEWATVSSVDPGTVNTSRTTLMSPFSGIDSNCSTTAGFVGAVKFGSFSVCHIAIICSDYQKSKQFYCEILGLNIKQEVFRAERNSYKLDLEVAGQYQIELFSFPDPSPRPSRPEAAGLRHIAFEVNDIEAEMKRLTAEGFVLLNEKPKLGADNKLVCFLHPKSTNAVLIELCMDKSKS